MLTQSRQAAEVQTEGQNGYERFEHGIVKSLLVTDMLVSEIAHLLRYLCATFGVTTKVCRGAHLNAPKWYLEADDHNCCYFCQLRGGKWAYNSQSVIETE